VKRPIRETKTTEEDYVVVCGETFILDKHQVILELANYSSHLLADSMLPLFY